MNLYDYFIDVTPEKMVEDFVAVKKCRGYKNFPRNRYEFCSILGLEDDPRITVFEVREFRYIEFAIGFDLPVPEGYPREVYTQTYHISGNTYRLTITGGDFHCPQLNFGNKKFHPTLPESEKKDYNALSYCISCKEIDKNFSNDIPNKIKIKKLIDTVPLVYKCIDTVLKSYETGEYWKCFEKIGFNRDNIEFITCDPKNFPYFNKIVSLMTYMNKFYEYDISLEDTIAIMLYSSYNYDPYSRVANKDPRANGFSIWGVYDEDHHDVYNFKKEEIPSFVEEVRKKIRDLSNEIDEYAKAMDGFNMYIATEFAKLKEEAFKKFGLTGKDMYVIPGNPENIKSVRDKSIRNKGIPDGWKR